MDAYPRPGNCDSVIHTRVNPELWAALKSTTKALDNKLQKIQQLFLRAVVPIARALDGLLKANDAGGDRQSTAKLLLDGVTMLGAANCELNNKRRELIRPELSLAFKPLCSAESVQATSSLLFGDNLPQRCKELRDTHRLGLRAGQSPRPDHRYSAPPSRYRSAHQRKHDSDLNCRRTADYRQRFPARFRGSWGKRNSDRFRCNVDFVAHCQG